MNNDQSTKKNVEIFKSIVKEAFETEIKPVFLEMLCTSEKRIDRTNEMVCKLAESTREIGQSFATILTSFESSRATMQKSINELMKANAHLAQLLTKEKKERDEERRSADMERQRLFKVLEVEKAEKQALREQLHLATDKYVGCIDSYIRLSANQKKPSAKAEIRLGK